MKIKVLIFIMMHLGYYLPAQIQSRTLGNKSYEVANHIGNAMTVVSDRKPPTPETTNTTIAYNETDIKSFNDYYPYGMVLENRSLSKAEAHRYGFQGQKKDDEVKGKNNSVNYKYRIHDPRVGRFFAVDPLASKYPYNSTYAFSENTVVNAVELEGLERSNAQVYMEDGSTVELNTRNSNVWLNFKNKIANIFRHPSKHRNTIQKQNTISQTRFSIIGQQQNQINFPQTGRNLQRTIFFTGGTLLQFDALDIPDRFSVSDNNQNQVFTALLGTDLLPNQTGVSQANFIIPNSGNYTLNVFGDPLNPSGSSSTGYIVNAISPPFPVTIIEVLNETTGQILYGVGTAASTANFEKEYALTKDWGNLMYNPLIPDNPNYAAYPKYHEFKKDIIFYNGNAFNDFLGTIGTNFNNYQNNKVQQP